MKRDFSAESAANVVARALRAARARLRGRLFYHLGFFAKGTSRHLAFGPGARLINSKAIRLGRHVHFGVFPRMECFGQFEPGRNVKIDVGDGTSFGDYFHAGAINRIKIGNGVLGGSGILITDHNHGNPRLDLDKTETTDPKARPLFSKGEVVIEDNVWIGDGVVILPGVTIGNGAIVAANTVVRRSVPARTIYTGA